MNTIAEQNSLADKGIRFFTDFYNLIKAVEMYKENHPLTLESIRQMMNSLRDLMDWRKELFFEFDSNHIYLEGTQLIEIVAARSLAITRITSSLKDRNISSIIFDRNVTAAEMVVFSRSIGTSTTISIDARDLPSYLRSKSIFSIRLNQSMEVAGVETGETLLLQHFIEGSLGDVLTEAVREKLFGEIIDRSRIGSRQLLEYVYREENHNHPVVPRDILPSLGEKWVHLVGTVRDQILNVSQDPNIIHSEKMELLLKNVIVTMTGLPPGRRGDQIAPMLFSFQAGDYKTTLNTFNEIYRKCQDAIGEYEGFTSRISQLISEIIETSQIDAFDSDSVLTEFKDIILRVLNHPTLNEKLFMAINQVRNSQFIFDVLTFSLAAYSKTTAPFPEISLAMKSRVIRFCTIERGYCGEMLMQCISLFTETTDETFISFFADIIEHLQSELCVSCENLPKCPVFEMIASRYRRGNLTVQQRKSLIDIWKQAALHLVHQNADDFRRIIVPYALDPFNPEDHQENEIRDYLISAWMSFGEAPVFRTIFQNLISENRDLRFRTIHELSNYGAFAIWICLSGLNNPNWHLRRNLATVMGQVVDLRQTNLLREPLRDHDWHVRLEIIKALGNRAEEIEQILNQDPNHAIIKLFSMALHDGNKSIRQEVYRSIERLKISQSFKSLKELYNRLAMMNLDADIEERVRIIRLLGLLASNPTAPQDTILEFIVEIATMREGIITPNWMIPIKKASVEALASMSYPEANRWLTVLSSEKPYKRGVVGREARTALQKLNKK